MAETQWQQLPPEWRQDKPFQEALLTLHREIYHRFFNDASPVNDKLGFHLHTYRRNNRWRTVLILTPWMMSRLLFPEQDPHIIIPQGWSGEDRYDTDYQILGPSLRLGWSGNQMQAHLNYHVRLGHYLLQPITLNMQGYSSPEQVFNVWRAKIDNLDKNGQLAPLSDQEATRG